MMLMGLSTMDGWEGRRLKVESSRGGRCGAALAVIELFDGVI